MAESTSTAETRVTDAVAEIIATYQRLVSDDERARITATVRAVVNAAWARGVADGREGQDEHLVDGEPR